MPAVERLPIDRKGTTRHGGPRSGYLRRERVDRGNRYAALNQIALFPIDRLPLRGLPLHPVRFAARSYFNTPESQCIIFSASWRLSIPGRFIPNFIFCGPAS